MWLSGVHDSACVSFSKHKGWLALAHIDRAGWWGRMCRLWHMHMSINVLCVCIHVECDFFCLCTCSCVSASESTYICFSKHSDYTPAYSNRAGRQHWLNRFPAVRDRWWTPAQPGPVKHTAESRSTLRYEAAEDTVTKCLVVRDTCPPGLQTGTTIQKRWSTGDPAPRQTLIWWSSSQTPPGQRQLPTQSHTSLGSHSSSSYISPKWWRPQLELASAVLLLLVHQSTRCSWPGGPAGCRWFLL